jgi:hypothetical protein
MGGFIQELEVAFLGTIMGSLVTTSHSIREKYQHYGLRIRFEVFTAMTMMDSVFWDIISQFLPHIKHITSPL